MLKVTKASSRSTRTPVVGTWWAASSGSATSTFFSHWWDRTIRSQVRGPRLGAGNRASTSATAAAFFSTAGSGLTTTARRACRQTSTSALELPA